VLVTTAKSKAAYKSHNGERGYDRKQFHLIGFNGLKMKFHFVEIHLVCNAIVYVNENQETFRNNRPALS